MIKILLSGSLDMTNACVSNMLSNERNFGHCIVSWEIENYGRALWQKNLEIETPEFSIEGPHSKNTNWKLVLQTESNRNSLIHELNVNINYAKKENLDPLSQKPSEICVKSNSSNSEKEKNNVPCLNENKNVDSRLSMKTLMLYLKRSSDEGPAEVCVDCKVYYINIKGKKVSLVHDEHVFYKNTKYGFNIGILYDFDREFEYNSGLTTILCDMIVTDPDMSENFYDDISIDLYGLSEDLKWIYDRQELCDAKIKINGKSVKVHKAMLCSHSYFLKQSIVSSDIIELSDLKYNEVLKVLAYMYSHDLKDVIGKPSVSIYDSAVQMNLSELIAHYDPEEIKINTTIDVKKLTYTWVINDFTKISDCVSSPILKNKHDDTAWRIHLYPKGKDGNGEYLSLRVECIDGTIPNDSCLECAVLINNENFNSITLQKNEDNTIATSKNFISREDVFKLLSNDSLIIGFRVRVLFGKNSSCVKEPCIPVLYSKKKSFENMARNMLSLHESRDYTDVTFNFGKKKIKAHKFIISARSRLPFKEFEETCSSMPLLQNHPEIFQIILDYMYSATFEVSNIDTVIDIYKSADELAIPRLQEKCSLFLQNSVRVNKVGLIVELANEHDDKYLKETTEKFVKNLKDSENAKHETEAVLDCIVSIGSIPKIIHIKRYNEGSVESYKFRLCESSFNENETQIKHDIDSSDTTEQENVSSDSIFAKYAKDLHVNREKRTQTPLYCGDSSKPAQNDKETHFSNKSCRNDMDLLKIIAESEENEALEDDIIYVHIDSKTKKIKENQTTSDKNACEPNKRKKVKELCLGLDYAVKLLQKCQKQMEAEINKKMALEKHGRNLKSTENRNAPHEIVLQSDSDLNKLHQNGKQSLNEKNRSYLKTSINLNEPHNGLKPGNALNELDKNGQVTLDKQSGNDLLSDVASNVPHKEDLKLDAAANENGQKSLGKQN